MDPSPGAPGARPVPRKHNLGEAVAEAFSDRPKAGPAAGCNRRKRRIEESAREVPRRFFRGPEDRRGEVGILAL